MKWPNRTTKFSMPGTTPPETDVWLRRSPILTACWLATSFAFIVIAPPSWTVFREIDKIGSFIQGVFAPLAFFWLVIAVLLQHKELSLQREELRQSRMALELQAQETRAAVQQFSQQTEIFRLSFSEEQISRQEMRLVAGIENLARSASQLMELIYFGRRSNPTVNPSVITPFNKEAASRHLGERQFDEAYSVFRQGVINCLRHLDNHTDSPDAPWLELSQAAVDAIQQLTVEYGTLISSRAGLVDSPVGHRVELLKLERTRDDLVSC